MIAGGLNPVETVSKNQFWFFFPAGIDFKIRTVEVEGKRIKLQVW